MTDFGILQPFLKFKWQIKFFDDGGNYLAFTKPITRQSIRVYKLKQLMGASQFGLVQHGSFFLDFEEDVTNTAMMAVQKLAKLNSFTIKIETLMNGSEEVGKTTTLKGVSISSIKHSDLDYGAQHQERMRLEVNFPALFGEKIDKLIEHPIAEMIHQILSNAKIEAIKPSKVPVAIQSAIEFSFTLPIQVS